MSAAYVHSFNASDGEEKGGERFIRLMHLIGAKSLRYLRHFIKERREREKDTDGRTKRG